MNDGRAQTTKPKSSVFDELALLLDVAPKTKITVYIGGENGYREVTLLEWYYDGIVIDNDGERVLIGKVPGHSMKNITAYLLSE